MVVVGHVLAVVLVVVVVLLIQRVVSSSRGVSVGNNIDER
jgi:preprotein translocase subunit SecG